MLTGVSLIVFRSGFVEGVETDTLSTDQEDTLPDDANGSVAASWKDGNESVVYSPRFEDSDDEDDNDESVPDPQIELQLPETFKRPRSSRPSSRASTDQGAANDEDGSDGRNVKAKLSHPSSPREPEEANSIEEELVAQSIEPAIPGPKKVKVVVKDVAYSTYRAVLNYVSLPPIGRSSES